MLPAERQTGRSSYFEPEFGTVAVKIVAGECFATADPVAITTVLGSCVSVCLYDVERGVGGMNHFMLPELLQGRSAIPCSRACSSNCCARYGSCAMRLLLQQLEQLGTHRSRLAAKVFGAGRVMAMATDIGASNASFALEYLRQEGIPVVASDLGDCCPRKLVFFPRTGKAWVKRMRDLPAARG
jgi:chemotaxis protein CheD